LPLFLIRTDIGIHICCHYRKGYKKISKGYVKGYRLKNGNKKPLKPYK